MVDSIIIWQFSDQKPGHENQSKGLIRAIKNRNNTTKSHRIIVPLSVLSFLYSVFTGSFYRQLTQLPKPTHLIAVGSRTHLPMLFAHFWFGGKRILLMRSHWPKCWFDYMIIPAHDKPKTQANIFASQGVINNITPSASHQSNAGLILLGGPSKHYHWNNEQIMSQVSELIHAMPQKLWVIANSRRTPTDLFKQLATLLPQSQLVDYKTVDSNWLPSQLTTVEQVWVSPDSVSMVYESLSSGALVGSLMLKEARKNDRIVNGINKLIEQNMLTSFEIWQTNHKLSSTTHSLYEAQRAADWILTQ